MESTKKLVRTGFAALIAIVCALALTLGLTACGSAQSEEDAVKKAVASELDQFKNVSEEAYNAFESAGGEQIEAMGIDGKEFIDAWLDGFDYTIGDVAVEGDTATVKVNLTSKNLVGALMNIQSEATTYFQENGVSSQDEAYKAIGQLMMDDITNATPESMDVELTLEKDSKGNWAITSDGMSALMNAIVGDTAALGL
jgi:hypothetical protein